MTERGEAELPKPKEVQRSCSWMPATPEKPNSMTQHPISTTQHPISMTQHQICGNSLGNDSSLPGGMKSVTCSPLPTAEKTFEAETKATDPKDILQNTEKMIKDTDNLDSMPFQTLMALADSGNLLAIQHALTNSNSVNTSNYSSDLCFKIQDPCFKIQDKGCEYSDPCFKIPDEGCQSSGSSRMQGQVNFSKETSGDGVDITSVPRGVSSVQAFDLNSTPTIMKRDAHFKPITPQKRNKGESLTVEATNNNILEDRVKEHHKKEKSNLMYQSSAQAQLQENRKPEGSMTDEFDFTKTPQKKARRRKHQPKVITEGQKKSIPKSSANTPSVPQETTRVKRKYVRRKGVNNPSVAEITGAGSNQKLVSSKDAPTEITTATEVVGGRRTGSSCRKSLNFNTDYQFGDESSSCSMNKLQEDNSSNMDPLKDTPEGDQTLHARGKCQIVFSNVTDDQVRPKSLGRSICSSACLTPERQVCGLKRQSMATTDGCNQNEAETLNSFMPGCLPLFSQNADKNNDSPGVHLPTIYKKNKTEKGHIASNSENNVTNPEIDGNETGRMVFEDLQALGPTEEIRKTRTKGPTQLQDLASLPEVCGKLPGSTSGVATTSCMRQNNAFLHEPPTCMEALVANTNAKTRTKKRSKKSMVINSAVPNLYNHQKSATTSMGPPMDLTLTYKSHVDSDVEQLSQLDLNAKSNQASVEKRNAFMAYNTHYHEQHALVPYQRSGDVVPFHGSFDQGEGSTPRPKVNLDDETTRVWKLLLENINSEGIDGTNEAKSNEWEKERRVFKGRAESFIARMHLIQGDRRFSPWKGSVVDSVVGVFLTQNVTDHLSSSAFMSMAARFPLKSKTQPADLHEEELDTEEVRGFNCGSDPDGTFRLNNNILNQSVCGEDTKMSQDFKGDNKRKVNSVNPSGNSSDGFILKETLGFQSPNTSKNGQVMSKKTTASKSVSLIEDGREAENTLSSQTPEFSSQYSSDSPIEQTPERSDYCLPRTSEEEPTAGADTNRFNKSTSFVKLLNIASTGTVLHRVYEGSHKTNPDENRKIQSESSALDFQNEGHLDNTIFPAKTIAPNSKSTLCHVPNSRSQGTESDLSKQDSKFVNSFSNKDLCSVNISELSSESASGTTFQKITDVSFEGGPKSSSTQATSSHNDQGEIQTKGQVPARSLSRIRHMNNFKNPEHKEVNSSKNGPENFRGTPVDEPKAKAGRTRKEKKNQVDWEHMRKQTLIGGTERAKTANTMDSVDWEAVRCADVNEIAETIKERGMNNKLAERIKDFLNRIVRDHGSIDLEWLRDVPPDKTKEYLFSFMGLGLKSVECVRLLTLHHLAFPVDTNVGRIAVRLGWVPLQPLPESVQLHLLEMYPVLASIQKYLWPRLCKLDQRTLYELHYQMITFGKVFCTKTTPNCNACPMKGECRHFASAFASARLALPAPEKGRATENKEADQIPVRSINTLQLPSPETNQMTDKYEVSNSQPIIEEPPSPQPIHEVPATPEQVYAEASQCDIESAFNEDPDEIPTIQLNMEEFTHNLQKIMQQNIKLQEGDMSKALVALTSESASIPVPKLKNVNQLRTEHYVYELPDSHPLLEGMDKREPEDPCPYLLAIWTPGETVDSIEPPERRCSSHEFEKLCTDEACSSCNSKREDNSQTVRGTLLIPCRTAMRGSFPLNGTYFQVNEVFSDHESSLSPINVPRQWLWNLRRRTVYFGTSIVSIFKGMTTEEIQYCFWRGFVCIRGFDRKTRAPRPLIARMHFPASKLAKGKRKTDKN